MLRPPKRITKKELREDTLTTTYVKVTAFYEKHKQYFNYGLAGLAVLVIVIAVVINNRRTNNESAMTNLGKVFPLYDSAAADPRYYQVAIDGRPERGIMGLRSIVNEYGSTMSGELARFYLANALYYTNKVEEALEEFEDFSSSDALLEASAFAGAASCYERKEEFEKAGSMYERAAGKLSVTSPMVPDYLSAAGRSFARAGNKEKALALYRRVKKEFPNSNAGREVDRYISELTA